jgi:glycine cleavage system H protein
VAEYDLPDNLRYSQEDEWARIEGRRATLGVTDYAQQQLGDIVFVELPAVGQTFEKGEPFGVIESVKAVSDLFSPLSGEVVEVNRGLTDEPESVNEGCYGDGWMITLELANDAEVEGLMDAAAYAKFIDQRAE